MLIFYAHHFNVLNQLFVNIYNRFIFFSIYAKYVQTLDKKIKQATAHNIIAHLIP